MSKTYTFKVISPSVLGVEFKKEEHMALMFMRIQEFTEGFKKLRGNILSEGDTLIAYLEKRKKLYYKAGWAGFNIKGETIVNILTKHDEIVWNKYEKELILECEERFFRNFGYGNWYVLAYIKGDKATKRHEKIHATFYLEKNYRLAVWDVIDKNGTKKAKKYLKNLDYNFPKGHDGEYILIDEVNAYAMDEKCHKMRKKLGLSRKTFKKLKTLYKDYVK